MHQRQSPQSENAIYRIGESKVCGPIKNKSGSDDKIISCGKMEKHKNTTNLSRF